MAWSVTVLVEIIDRFRSPEHPELRFLFQPCWDRDSWVLSASDGTRVHQREIAEIALSDQVNAINVLGVEMDSLILEMFPEETNAISEQQEVLFKHDDPNLQGSVDRLREPR